MNKISAALRLGAACAAAIVLPATQVAAAQPYPSKQIRFIIPYVPAGANDIIGRTLQGPLSQALGVSVIVENRPGAGGAIGTAYVAGAAPDGYTFLIGNTNTNAILPLIQKSARYDTLRDFTPVSMLGNSPIVIVGNPATGVTDMAGVIARAKKAPNGITYGHSGIGTMGQLSAELLGLTAHMKMIGVPYKGQAQAVQAVMAGEVDLGFGGPASSLNGLAKSGKINVLGVTSAGPSDLVPGAPSVSRFMDGQSAEIWFALFAPAKTPDAIVQRMNAEVMKVLARPDIRARFADFSVAPQWSSPAQLGEAVKDDTHKWQGVITQAGIKEE